jgi:hypothetical protein
MLTSLPAIAACQLQRESSSLQDLKDLSEEESSDSEPVAYDGIIAEPPLNPTGLRVKVRGTSTSSNDLHAM